MLQNIWQKIWAACGRSATIAVGYIGAVLGILYANLDNLAGVVVDPSIVAWVHSVIDSHPVIAKYTFAGFGAIVILARMRSMLGAR
jgi:hypothetical protein